MTPSYNPNQVIQGDVREVLRDFPNNFFDTCITSPPYWSLRQYIKDPEIARKEIGREPSSREYVQNIIKVFDVVRPKIKQKGSLWVNLGDTYYDGSPLMIPEEFARQMVMGHGWKLVNKVVWFKVDAMSESAQKRFKQSWEPFYWFVKDKDYYFNNSAAKIPVKASTVERMKHKFYQNKGTDVSRMRGMVGDQSEKADMYLQQGVNAGDVWTLPTNKRKVEHAAPYPVHLVVRPLVATCPPNGTVLDPFAGSGTTGIAALDMGEGRSFYGVDLNPDAVREANEDLKEMTKQPTLL